MAVRCAILDDYQNVVLTSADWSKVKGDLEIKVFNEHLGGPDKVIAALKGFQIVVATRERTGFPKQVIDALPDLKLLISTGMRNASIDTDAAKARGVTVCGTPNFGNPTAGIAIGLMLELTRHIGYENARLHAGAPWQSTIGPDLEGMTLGVLGQARRPIRCVRRRHSRRNAPRDSQKRALVGWLCRGSAGGKRISKQARVSGIRTDRPRTNQNLSP
jgi:D-3-phosphoglycerate dehydrogenase